MKGVTKENIKKYALNEFLTEYKELNTDNKYRPVAVGRYGIRKRESIYSKELAKDYSKNKLIHKGTLTVGMGSKQIDIGILIEDETFAVSPAYHTYEIQGIRCKYLEYCLQSKNIEMFSLYAKRGSRQGKSIDLKRWLTYKIPVYSEKDQIVIEENLNKINYVIELRRKQIDLLDELVKARFVEMFGDPNIEFKYSSVKFNDLVARMTKGPFGSDIKKDLFVPKGEDTYKVYIQINAIQKNQSLGEYYISKEYFDRKVSRFELFPNDYIITCDGTLGKYLKLDENMEKGVISPSLLRLTLQNDKINDKYFENIWDFYMLGLMKKEARNACLVHLPSAKKIGEISIPVPPLELQNQFASFVEEIDKSRSRIQKSLEASQELFDSLMQEYFG